MKENTYYSEADHGPWHTASLGEFTLEEGMTLPQLNLVYATHGKLNSARDNAILVPTWYSGTSKIMEQVYVGAGRALDPEKYFIIIANQIGSGISTSPHNSEPPFNMGNFPNIRIADDVRAQHKLITEHLKIDTLALVVGGSMGAQQTYEWAVRYPDMVKRAAPIAGYAKNTDHDYLYTQTLIEAITSDPGYNEGEYSSHLEVKEGLKRHAKIWSTMGVCTEFFAQECWKELGFNSVMAFQTDFMEALFTQMDPNNLLCMAWKWQRGDVSRASDGDLTSALSRIKAKTFVMPIDTDMFFTVKDCKREQEMIAGSEFRPLTSLGGHLALFGFDKEYLTQVDSHLKDLLSFKI